MIKRFRRVIVVSLIITTDHNTFNQTSHSFLCSSEAGVLIYFFFFNDTATTDIYTLSLHDALPISPEKAFDGRGDTRASIGNTHLEHGSPTAEVIGDTFVFDMQTCNQLGKIHMFAAAPPNNQGSFDARDFPGAVEVRVSGDCITSAQGTITGTFGPVVATGMEPQPGCQDNGTPCNMPFVINFPQPTAAKCVSIRLTKILKIGGGVWWAIDELQAYPSSTSTTPRG